MKYKFLGFVFLLFSFTLFAQNPIEKHGFLHVCGVHLLDQNNRPVALHGVSYGWHNFWPRFYNERSVAWLARDWHATVVRAAIGVEPEGGYISDPSKAVKAAEAIIEGAIHSGIYVIVDWHSHNIHLNQAIRFFATIARKYHRYPNIIYEVFNEPDEESWPEVKAYAGKMISVIRRYDRKNIILVGSPHWDQDINLPAVDPVRNEANIMYTVHFYAATHKESLRQRCDSALAAGLPLFISESGGMDASGDGDIDYSEWNKWIMWADKRKISWVVWSVSDKEESCSMLKKSAKSEGDWRPEDIKPSGIYTKSILKKYYK